MKKRGHSRRLLSVLLALVMLLSLLPTAVFAADPAPQTFKKVTSAEELVTGQYVLVDEKGFSPKELSGKWVPQRPSRSTVPQPQHPRAYGPSP